MANNRLWLVCHDCVVEPKDFFSNRFLLAKHNMNAWWAFGDDHPRGPLVDWLKHHELCFWSDRGLDWDHQFVLEYETATP